MDLRVAIAQIPVVWTWNLTTPQYAVRSTARPGRGLTFSLTPEGSLSHARV